MWCRPLVLLLCFSLSLAVDVDFVAHCGMELAQELEDVGHECYNVSMSESDHLFFCIWDVYNVFNASFCE